MCRILLQSVYTFRELFTRSEKMSQYLFLRFMTMMIIITTSITITSTYYYYSYYYYRYNDEDDYCY
jgi:hypothetical protein